MRMVVAGIAAVALALTACSSGKSGPAFPNSSGPTSPTASSTASSTTSSPAPSTSGVPATSRASATSGAPTTSSGSTPASTSSGSAQSTSSGPPSGPPSGPEQRRAVAALLTAAEIGHGFVQHPSETSRSPLPCTPNEPPLSTRYPALARADATSTTTDQKAQLAEEVIVYGSRATAAQSLAAGVHGLSCKTARVNVSGTTVTYHIVGPGDLTHRVGVQVDRSLAWSITAAGLQMTLWVTQLGNKLVVLTFAAESSVDQATLPPAQLVVSKALRKVKATLP